MWLLWKHERLISPDWACTNGIDDMFDLEAASE